MVCSICGSEGTNKSTCPLLLKNPTEENWKKHPKAKRPTSKIQLEKPKPTLKKTFKISPRPEPKSLPFPASMRYKQKPKFTVRPNFINPYIALSKKVCDASQDILRFYKKKGLVILTGNQLSDLGIFIKEPSKMKIELDDSKFLREKMADYMTLFCDINRRLAEFKVTSADFFTRPNQQTSKILKMLPNITALFINFILDHRHYGGGSTESISRGTIDISMPLENIIEADEVIMQLSKIKIPTGELGQIKSSVKEKKKVGVLIN